MTSLSAPPDPAQRHRVQAQPSVKAFIVQHKPVSIGILLLLLVFVALLVPAVIGSGSWKVTDATSCSSWSSANQNQQTAYAHLYVTEHGALPNGESSRDSIERAINSGCTAAFAYDEADSVNVVQAIDGRY
jgi:hypothetical protein